MTGVVLRIGGHDGRGADGVTLARVCGRSLLEKDGRHSCGIMIAGLSGLARRVRRRRFRRRSLGKRSRLSKRIRPLGGAAINTGTIPSKALREAVLHLTGASKRGLFGEGYRSNAISPLPI